MFARDGTDRRRLATYARSCTHAPSDSVMTPRPNWLTLIAVAAVAHVVTSMVQKASAMAALVSSLAAGRNS